MPGISLPTYPSIFGAVTVLMFWPGYKTNLVSFLLFGLFGLWLWHSRRPAPPRAAGGDSMQEKS